MTLREEVQQQIQYASEAILERVKSILEEDDELLEEAWHREVIAERRDDETVRMTLDELKKQLSHQ
jgi:FMN phosphatase YigB (HAD superfamily)